MNPNGSPSPFQGAPQRASRLLLPFFLGADERMTLPERSRLIIQNAGAWLMIVFGATFMILNASKGIVSFVGINSAFISVGMLSLWLTSIGFQRTGLVILSAGSCLVFFFAGIWLRNDMDNFLLVTLCASLLLLDQAATRWALAALNGSAFLYAKVLIYDGRFNAMTPSLRYGLNILVFLFALIGIIEFFRVLNSDYLHALELANRRLDAANRAKERLFSVIAHDLRGPVGNLKVSLEMLSSGTLAAGEFDALISDLSTDVEKSHDCLENLLNWAATQLDSLDSHPVSVPLHDAVEESMRLTDLVVNRKNLRVTNDIPAEAVVYADKDQLQAILRNLLSNAEKFTLAGGSVRLAAGREGGEWVLSIEDTGVGMPEEKARRLFSASHREMKSDIGVRCGLGIGTEICRDFTRMNGGSIRAVSAPSQGTKVFLSLPVAVGQEETTAGAFSI